MYWDRIYAFGSTTDFSGRSQAVRSWGIEANSSFSNLHVEIVLRAEEGNMLGSYRDNGKENGNYDVTVGSIASVTPSRYP